jgi:hypothetical protein
MLEPKTTNEASHPKASTWYSWFLLVVGVSSLLAYTITVGPDLLGAWSSTNPDAGLVRFVTTVLLILTLLFTGTLLLASRLTAPRRGLGRRKQLLGTFLAMTQGALLVLVGYLFRGGALNMGDPYGKLAMLLGLVILLSGTYLAWPSKINS